MICLNIHRAQNIGLGLQPPPTSITHRLPASLRHLAPKRSRHAAEPPPAPSLLRRRADAAAARRRLSLALTTSPPHALLCMRFPSRRPRWDRENDSKKALKKGSSSNDIEDLARDCKKI